MNTEDKIVIGLGAVAVAIGGVLYYLYSQPTGTKQMLVTTEAFNPGMLAEFNANIAPKLGTGSVFEAYSAKLDVAPATMNSWATEVIKANPALTLCANTVGIPNVRTLASGLSKDYTQIAATYEPEGAGPLGPTDANTCLSYFSQVAAAVRASGRKAVAYPTVLGLTKYGWDYGKIAAEVDVIRVETQGLGSGSEWATGIKQIQAQLTAANQPQSKLWCQITLGTDAGGNGVDPATATTMIAQAQALGIGQFYLWAGSGGTAGQALVEQVIGKGTQPPPPPPPQGGTKFMVVTVENANWSDVTGGKAPYMLGLARQYGCCSNYLATNQANGDSLPNYMSWTCGSLPITKDEAPPTQYAVANPSIFDNLESKGVTWMAYAEDYPGSPSVAQKGQYAARHVPSLYYKNNLNSPTRLAKTVALTAFSTTAIPTYSIITPNLFDDGHTPPDITNADNWLKGWLPAVLASADFTSGNLVINIVCDNGTPPSAPTISIWLWAGMKAPVMVTTPANHYSMLATIENKLGLPYLTSNDQNAPQLSEFFA
jgi:Phosphoesterase family